MNQNDPPTEHILACLSSSPSNAKIVRTASTMAKAFGGTFTALYVRTPDSDQMGKEDCRRLQQHIRMAEQAGADISTIYGDDIPQQIAEFARISGITKIVLGRSSVHRRHFWSGPSLTEKLTLTAPNLDIYIIPDASAENGYGSGRKLFTRPLLPSVRDLLITAGILSCITLIGFIFLQLDFARYNIIMLYMLGVLFTALSTSGYTCGVLGSVASVALYNFFMTEPYLTFHAYDPGYQVTFALMLTSAIITCTLTTRLKDHAKMSAQAAFRTKILFDTNQLLQRAKSEEEILSQTASQLMKLLIRSLEDWYGDENPIMYLRKTGKMSEKDFQFLLSLEKKDVTEITDDEYGKFLDLVTKYNKKMPRKFFLENENIKDPKGLVDRMVRESFVRMPNPSNHIKDVVATEDEWNKIVEYSKQTDLSEKDTKQLRKLLNKFIKRDEFFSTEVWYNREVSARMIKIANINAKENKTAIEKNNINAKALYIAYPEYFSKLEKWDN